MRDERTNLIIEKHNLKIENEKLQDNYNLLQAKYTKLLEVSGKTDDEIKSLISYGRAAESLVTMFNFTKNGGFL